MLKHIVMWKIKDDVKSVSKAENISKMKNMLENLKTIIPEILELEVGADINRSDAAFDVTLYSVFEDEHTLLAYQKHPEHVKVAEFVGTITEQRCLVDYLI